ncbi:MAG: Hsp20 family protein [Burkholderiaceae bacterium]
MNDWKDNQWISDLMSARMFPDIERFLKEFSMPPVLRDLQSRMKLDVEETPQGYLVKAEVPGVNKDDISIDISGNAVSIRAGGSERGTGGKTG